MVKNRNMRYELLKDWPSERHGKTIRKGTFVVITKKEELEQLVELKCIPKPKAVKKKKVKK
tara:strand:- start:347 stop:529 length:183 start_codon:yes stop_codon:yes gene_type:complete